MARRSKPKSARARVSTKKRKRGAPKRRAIPSYVPSDARAMAAELGIPFTEKERREAKKKIKVVTASQRRRSFAAKRGWVKRRFGPPKAISIADVAQEWGPATAIEFARKNLIPPIEWADEVADDYDLDIHDLYEAYYDTDPAAAA